MAVAFVVAFSVPVFLLAVGYVLKNRFSDFPDTSVGYHVGKLGGVSRETWKSANRFSGTLFLTGGFVVAGIDTALLIYSVRSITGPLSAYLWWVEFMIAYLVLSAVLPVLVAILCTELYLRRNFSRDGIRKKSDF